ncbi:hypothetical protein C5O00_11490 [Pukyongia salina]|uniref:Uncharacterized protein n=1 Tax=Pukyongia salina TaxID=2094025 RepID=A0A2S0HYW3_9FLAO|nr:hypothetical protein [Pukyongia salina]AVI51754.1 hypothetical protein C5O00_11490 [Pukyongia salina]
MIKFFRKIRHRLLSENKFSKYLIYAIGEIILVVIGILIALYINNLNTEKQDAITLNGYLNNIAENIKSDQINLEKISVFRDSSIIGSMYFMTMIEQESKDQYKIYFSKYFNYNPWLDESFQSNQSGFEALKNSGYLNKIHQTDLETQLYKYYSLVQKIKDEEQSLNNFMEEMEYDMYKNNIVQKTKLIIRKLFKNIETPDDINQLQQILNYPAFVGSHSRNSGTKYMNDLYKELMIVNENLMAEIEEITKG